jgi:hypothetical protein
MLAAAAAAAKDALPHRLRAQKGRAWPHSRVAPSAGLPPVPGLRRAMSVAAIAALAHSTSDRLAAGCNGRRARVPTVVQAPSERRRSSTEARAPLLRQLLVVKGAPTITTAAAAAAAAASAAAPTAAGYRCGMELEAVIGLPPSTRCPVDETGVCCLCQSPSS